MNENNENPIKNTPSEESNTTSPSDSTITPEEKPTVVPSKPKLSGKATKIHIAIIVILLLIIAGLTTWLVITLTSTSGQQSSNTSNISIDNNTANQSDQDDETDVQDSTKEAKITDTHILNDLHSKLAYLHITAKAGKLLETNDNFVFYDMTNPAIHLYTSSLSQDEKAYTLLFSLELDNKFSHALTTLSETELLNFVKQHIATTSLDVNAYEQDLYKNATIIDANYVRERYQNLFGESLDSKDYSLFCSSYLYYQEKDLYIDPNIGGCGGYSPNRYFLYKEKFTQNDNLDKAYAYVRVGNLYRYDIDAICEIRNDIEENSKVITSYSSSDCPSDSENLINSSNYQNFTPYRFVFDKNDDGTYHFSKVEKL